MEISSNGRKMLIFCLFCCRQGELYNAISTSKSRFSSVQLRRVVTAISFMYFNGFVIVKHTFFIHWQTKFQKIHLFHSNNLIGNNISLFQKPNTHIFLITSGCAKTCILIIIKDKLMFFLKSTMDLIYVLMNLEIWKC